MFDEWVLSHRAGHSVGKKDVKEYLSQFREDVGDKTVRNYLARAISVSASVTNYAKYKQEARNTAEESLRRVQAWSTAVCAVMVREGKSSCRPQASVHNKAVFAVTKALGHSDVFGLHPSLIFNADDFSVLMHTGEEPKKEVRAVPHDHLRCHIASYKLDNPNPAVYMSAHLSVLVNSGTFLGDTVIRVGVKEREWKGSPEDNLVIVKVPGLCRGGNTHVKSANVGYIVLMKNMGEKESESVDQAFFRWFHSTITLPFINDVREECYPEWKTGDDVKPGMEAVLTIDGLAKINFVNFS